MDLWDLTKLLLRRWYFALPMLLGSVALMILTAQTVNPDYKATGNLQMIPPPGLGKPVDPKGPARPHNPWLDLGYQALGNAALLKVTDLPVLEQLERDGFSSSVTITLADRLPLLSIEAIGTSREQATATVRQVIKLLVEDILGEQKRYGVAPIDTITTLTLNDGATVEVVTSKVKRALIVAGGVGGLVTIAGTITLDALVRRRGRRQQPVPTVSVPISPAPVSPAPASAPGAAEPAAWLPLPATTPRGPQASPTDSAPVPIPGAVERLRGAEQAARGTVDDVPLTVEFKQVPDQPPAAEESLAEDGSDTTVLPADATIVLRLPPNGGWPWNDGRNGRR